MQYLFPQNLWDEIIKGGKAGQGQGPFLGKKLGNRFFKKGMYYSWHTALNG